MSKHQFSYIFQHDETGRFTDQRYTLQDIEVSCGSRGTILSALWNGWTLVARRQFTGLHDKSGKEIYEGDVLRTPHFSTGVVTHHMRHVVEWSAKYAGWFAKSTVAKHDSDGCVQLWVYTKNTGGGEVIGNIYESPDLLE